MSKTTRVSLRPTWLAVAAASLFLSLPAQALVALDTFGPGDTATGSAWSLASDVDFGQDLAVAFTLDSASIITDILTSINGDGSFNLGIVAGADLPSGAYVYSTVLTNPTANSGATGLSWTLDAGAYWLVSRAELGSFADWTGGEQTGTAWAFTTDDGTWVSGGDFDAPAARITVTVVPEPGTWALMLGGLALCAAAARRQRV
jgi:hypothetical protein